MHSVSLEKFVKKFNLKVFTPEIEFADRQINKIEVNRPAIQFAGYFNYFDSDRIQLVGRVEESYLNSLEPERRRFVLRKVFSFKIPCLVMCKGIDPLPEMIEYAREFSVPIFGTSSRTSEALSEILTWLRYELAENVTLHGVFVDIYGEGILIMGDSGIGKSETALELIKRGHRLVADDAVLIKRINNSTLIGTSPELIRYFIEVRGIGVMNVKELFGVGSIKLSQNIDLVIKLEAWDSEKYYDRMGLTEDTMDILGNKVVCTSIPVKPGRNLAIICEAAAINCRQKKLGYNAALALTERVNANIKDSF